MRERGHTLIELMIAIAILGIGSLIFISALGPEQVAAAELGHRSAALGAAADAIEVLRAAPPGERHDRAARLEAEPVPAPPGARLAIALSPLGGADHIEVTVSWTSPRGAARALRLESALGGY